MNLITHISSLYIEKIIGKIILVLLFMLSSICNKNSIIIERDLKAIVHMEKVKKKLKPRIKIKRVD